MSDDDLFKELEDDLKNGVPMIKKTTTWRQLKTECSCKDKSRYAKKKDGRWTCNKCNKDRTDEVELELRVERNSN